MKLKIWELIKINIVNLLKRYDGNAPNNKIYERGYRYYLEGRVVNVKKRISELGAGETTIYSAKVKGTGRGYEARLFIEELPGSQEIIEAECDCPYYMEGNEVCKHMAALAYFIESTVNKAVPQKGSVFKKPVDMTRQVLKALEFGLEESKNPLELEMVFNPMVDGTRRYAVLEVWFRMGDGKKLYNVQDAKKFFEAYSERRSYPFGKTFSYEPAEHEFKEEDKELVEFILKLVQVDRTYYSYSERIFDNKRVRIPPYMEKEFLNILKNRKLKIGEEEYQISENIPELDFHLVKNGSGANLVVGQTDNLFFFRGDVILKGNTLHLIDPAFKRKAGELTNFFISRDELYIDNPAEFIQNGLPGLQKIAKLYIDEEIKKAIRIPREHRREIYLDWDFKAGGISATVKNLYDGIDVKKLDKNLLRSPKAEKETDTELVKQGFKELMKSSGRYMLYDDEEIYNFMNEGVKELSQKFHVFCSEDLGKKKYSKPTPKLTIKARGADVLEYSFKIDGVDRELIPELFKSLKEKRKYFRLKDGSIMDLKNQELERVLEILDSLGVDERQLQESEGRLQNYHLIYAEELSKTGALEMDIERTSAIAEKLQNFHRYQGKTIPAAFGMLRDYQKTGVRWLDKLDYIGMGGILADDMGLGKTLQLITFLNVKGFQKKAFIVVPTSLVYNWKKEFEKFSPSTRVALLKGTKKEREKILAEKDSYDVLITSYGTLLNDIKLYSDEDFGVIILDEAQNIKNPLAKTTRAVKELKGDMRFALTGTPIENNLIEIWSIFDFVMPGYLGKLQKFQQRINNIEDGISHMDNLKSMVRPFILRRLKKDVLKELPEKIETDILVELNKEEKKIYLGYLSKAREEISEDLGEIEMFALLTRLRQICCHPGLFLEDYSKDSSKLELLTELLEEYRESGHRVLIFSQFTGMLEFIKKKIELKDISYFYLDGSTKPQDRVKMCDEFNRGEKDVFLISLKAGGTGLNLTGADVVIHFDPWWNPAVEDQATDRAYRMGQDKKVQVVRLIAGGTIEERINEMKAYKKKVAKEILEGEANNLFQLKKEDILELLKK